MTDRPLIVVGAGIVGLAVAYHLRRDGAAVVVVDRDPEGDRASHGNAGGVAVTEVVPASVPGLLWKVPGWLLDPLGPLAIRPRHAPKLARTARPAETERIAAALSALNGRAYDDLPMLAATGLTGELHRNGALTIYGSRRALDGNGAEWDLKRRHGIEVAVLGRSDLLALEPCLGPGVECGVFTPQWSHVADPEHLVTSLRAWLRARDVAVVPGAVTVIEGADPLAVRLDDGRSLAAAGVVVAAGAWPGRLAKRFGGTAEFGGLDAVADHARSRALVELAARYLPGLRAAGGRERAGHRPATPDSLPVIGRSARDDNVLYAFGHGHLGLTQAATTGRLIADLVRRRAPPIDLAPYAITRFQ